MNTAIPVPGASPKASTPVMIAGQHAGRPIYCDPDTYPLFEELEKAGRRGSHWARIAIKELGALTTGHIGKSNVFVEESPHLRRHVFQLQTQDNPYIKQSITLFYAFLPGLQATISQRSDGSYFVANLQLDGRYFKATEKPRPGLYRASKSEEGRWNTEYVKDGRVKESPDRAVAIADTSHDEPDRAAEAAAPYVFGAPGTQGENAINSIGFDLHFTPGQRRLGGLINYNPLAEERAHGSAILLADAMRNANKTERVNWISEFGGSAILTQAMKTLVVQRVTLKSHTAYLYRPTTSPGEAVRLSHELGLELDKDFAKTGFDVIGGISKRRASRLRIENPSDRYDRTAHNKSVRAGLAVGLSVSGTAFFVGGMAGASFPAVSVVMKALGVAVGGLSSVNTMADVAQHAIEPYSQKIKSKRIGKG